ncbi:Pleiotropic drug resistance protein [Trichinella pseudospiralis]
MTHPVNDESLTFVQSGEGGGGGLEEYFKPTRRHRCHFIPPYRTPGVVHVLGILSAVYCTSELLSVNTDVVLSTCQHDPFL